jgi:hypothetical protein
MAKLAREYAVRQARTELENVLLFPSAEYSSGYEASLNEKELNVSTG